MDQKIAELRITNQLSEDFDPAFAQFISAIQTIDKRDGSLTIKLNSSGVFRGISFVKEESRGFYPCVSDGVIFISVRFVYFLWAYCSYLYLTTEHVMIREEAKTWNGFLDGSAQEVVWSFDFLRQFQASRGGSTSWDPNLFSPSTDCVASRDINVLFAMALVFIYLHELSHLNLRHDPRMDADSRLMAETDADLEAVRIFFGSSIEPETVKFRAIALGAVQGASINSLSDLSRLSSAGHPDPDVRLSNLVEYVELDDEKAKYYFMTVVGISLSTFCRDRGIPADLRTFDTAKESYEYYLDLISARKP